MGPKPIEGVLLTPLKTIVHPQGNVYHGIKNSDPGFAGFGEAYFSSIHYGEVKAWKKHIKMTVNLIVPVGEVKFVVYDDRTNSCTNNCYAEFVLGPLQYRRLTIKAGIWFGFMGLAQGTNLVLNVASRPHDPAEDLQIDKNEIPYEWSVNEPSTC